MTKLLLTNARIVNEDSIQDGDVLIEHGRIEQIANQITAGAGTKVMDLGGKHLFPGLIDDQVHFREPGLTHKGDIATEARAAVAGGITSFMDMPNVKPPTLTRELLKAKYNLAADGVAANYAFYMGASNDNIDEIAALKPGEACGLKVFMGASTGNMLVDKPEALRQIFARSPVPIITHCEDTPTITQNEQTYRKRYGDRIPMECHPEIRSVEACYKSSSLAVALAKENQARLHILHLTTAKELGLFSDATLDQKLITVEVCAHHLFFSRDDYQDKGGLIKCNPAIKTEHDRLGLIRGLNENLIDVIATDHAPHTWEEKQQDNYFDIPSGLPLVQHALQSLIEQYHRGSMSLELIANKTAHAPAQIFGVVDRGFIREGYWADLTVVDLDQPYTVSQDNVLYKCGWSPFEGYTFQSTVLLTLVNGETAFAGGEIMNVNAGQRMNLNSHQAR